MTKKTYSFASVVSASLLAVACLTGCTADFDFVEAMRANPEFAYRESFESEFGKISSDQSWDFTQQGVGGTRAGEDNISITPSWYNVENTTLRYIQTNLTLGQDHSDLGHPFAMTVPESGEVTVYPIYQGTGTSWELHMVSGSKDYKIWEKGQTISGGADNGKTYIQKDSGKGCPDCEGNGYVEKTQAIGDWNPKKVYSLSMKHSFLFISNNYYLNGTGSGFPRNCKRSTSEQKFAVIKIGGQNYLYYLSGTDSGFVTVVNNSITIEKSYSTPIETNVKENGPLKIGGRFLGTTGAIGGIWASGLVAAESTNYRTNLYKYNWTWNSSEPNESQKAAINSSVKREKCTTCEGTGIVLHSDTDADKWTNVLGNVNTSGTVLNSSTVDARQVRSRGIKVSGLSSGDVVYFYAKINNTGNNNSYFAVNSKIASSSNYMMALSNAPTINSSVFEGQEYVMLAVEDKKKEDEDDISEYQSAVFVISADEINELAINNGSFTGPDFATTKRYMVEDLGAVSSSDIDFNDAVFDIEQVSHYVYTNRNGQTSPDMNEVVTSQKVKILALGGTKDLTLKVGNTAIFTKGNPNQNGTRNLGFQDDECILEGGFEIGQMYNTGEMSINNYYNADDYLAEITLTGAPWDPATNNVYVVVSNTTTYQKAEIADYETDDDGNGTTTISFPNPGEVPAIIAVPITQKWNHEQVNAIKNQSNRGCYLKLQELAR